MQVCAMRLPAEVLEQHLRLILEGLLLWSEDSKNKFKLKVAFLGPVCFKDGAYIQSICQESCLWAGDRCVDPVCPSLSSAASAAAGSCGPVDEGDRQTGDGYRTVAALLLYGASDGWPQRSAGRPMQALRDRCAVRQVRVIVERLARRCGYDAVAAAMPAGDRRLLSHIQKEMLRKKRTQTKPGSEVSLAA